MLGDAMLVIAQVSICTYRYRFTKVKQKVYSYENKLKIPGIGVHPFVSDGSILDFRLQLW